MIVGEQAATDYLATVTVVPLTSTIRNIPTRPACLFNGVNGELAVDQIRSIDKTRLIRRTGKLDNASCRNLCTVLVEYLKY